MQTAPKFHATLLSSATRGLNLGDCLRTLSILLDMNTHSPDDFLKLLHACPRLYEVVLSCDDILEFQVDTPKKLQVAGQRLKAIDMVDCHPQSSILFQLLTIWPNIQFLTIRCINLQVPHCVAASLVPRRDVTEVQRPASGAKACLNELVMYHLLKPDVITWLIASSADSLRILDLGRCPLWPCVRIENQLSPIVFAPHASRLRSLRISYYDRYSAALLRMCTALEELVLLRFDHMSKLSLVPYLPRTIEHLAFGIRYDDCETLQPIIDAVGALPNLKILTCSKDVKRLIPHYNILKEKCKTKGVGVVVSDVPWVGGKFYNDAPALF
ncbi:hypothetical protein AZE42_02605 [Rhizopogon vesiculosus]|uniref:F-box domain-containing protein n=1 Tax=Rhizopogon vesiculosus TaxID=180088 RepID=A0A1J8R5S2_9AGAM|nr:hypothetical protein AZE42_02605 [Rhizopogon vesiculosus]